MIDMEYYFDWKEDIEDLIELREYNRENGGDDPTWSESGEYIDTNEYLDGVLTQICDKYDEDPINFFRFSTMSEFYNLLEQWADSRGESMEDIVRGYWEDGHYVYFVTGSGYDLYDADLLGGTGDGLTRDAFEEFISE